MRADAERPRDGAAAAIAGETRRAVELLHDPGDLIELRVLRAGRAGTVSGYYLDRAALVRDAMRWDGRAPGVYVTLHAIVPALLARAVNRAMERAQQTTSDADVLRYRWLPIDLDAVRPAGISSTDAEHDEALAVAARLVSWLIDEMGCPAASAVMADSGNGAHVLIRIDEPADAETRALVGRCLAAVDLRWSTREVQVDASTANPARIWRLYGTRTAKGDATPDRPHRRSCILDAPASIEAAPRALLERLAALAPTDPQPGARSVGHRLDVPAWLGHQGIAIARERPWQGGTLRELDGCPMDETHERDRAAYVITHPSGAVSAGCHHARCQGWGWRQLRERYEPHYRGEHRSDRPHEQGATASGDGRRVDLVLASSIVPQRIRWAWRGRLPLGELALFAGEPGVGKGAITVWLAARVTRGDLLGDLAEPRSVVIASAEDSPEYTLVPRLLAAGADLSRVHIVRVTQDGVTGALALPDDVAALRARVEGARAALVGVDPIGAHLGGDVDSHRDASVRRALAPLAMMAQETDAVVMAVAHLRGAPATTVAARVMGSVAFVAAARNVLIAADDPEGEGRVLAHAKTNTGALAPTLRYRIDTRDIEHRSEIIPSCAVTWLGEADGVRLSDILAPGEPEERTAREEAEDYLREALAGGPRPADELLREVERRTGASRRTLERARRSLGIESRPLRDAAGRMTGWTLTLPSRPPDSTRGGLECRAAPEPAATPVILGGEPVRQHPDRHAGVADWQAEPDSVDDADAEIIGEVP